MKVLCASLEENADVVIFVHRPEVGIKKHEAEKLGINGVGELIVAKNRHGEEGIIPMRFEGCFYRFTEDMPEDTETPECKPWSPGGNDSAQTDGRSLAAGECEVYDEF